MKEEGKRLGHRMHKNHKAYWRVVYTWVISGRVCGFGRGGSYTITSIS